MKTDITAQPLVDPQVAPAAEAIRKCVHCGFCLATCPTYVLLGDELDSPRGRIYLMKEMLEKQHRPVANVVKHVDRCLSCLACATTCPSGVDYQRIVDHARSYIEQNFRRPLSERLLRWLLATILPHRERFRWVLRLGQWASPLQHLTRHSQKLNSLTKMLAMAQAGPARRAAAANSPASKVFRGRVLLMQGCVESVLRPEIRMAAMRLLNRLGYDVEFSRRERCCGALVHHMGREQQSLKAIRHTVDSWMQVIESSAGESPLTAIVITATGCGTLIKDYGFVLRNDPEYADKAARISALAKDITEMFDPQELSKRSADSVVRKKQVRVAYHSACSAQHGQRIEDTPREQLEAAGFQVSIPREAHLCCGSAGVYSILHPTIAEQLGKRKTTHLNALNADVIATGNVGCAEHLRAYTGTPTLHVVELLDWATGGPWPEALAGGSQNSTVAMRTPT